MTDNATTMALLCEEMDTAALFKEIEDNIDSYVSNLWNAKLPFTGLVCMASEPPFLPGNSLYRTELDLLAYVGSNFLPKNHFVRFDPGIYPPACVLTTSLTKLKTDLQNAARLQGFELVSNGRRKKTLRISG